MVVSRATSSISWISDRRRCRREGYRIHHTSLGGRHLLAEAKKDAAPGSRRRGLDIELVYRWKNVLCRIQMFGWYKNPRVAPINSQSRIFSNNPSSQRLVSDDITFATADSSTSRRGEIESI